MILKFAILDSTNNYAMQMVAADKAEHGLIILADAQTAGKGQRGRTWSDTPGESLLMSLTIRPVATLQEQVNFLAAVAVAVAEVLEECLPNSFVNIKWPNDIIIADKKAGGILIENVVRGTSWDWAVVGIGLNVFQESFPSNLPHATSLTVAGLYDILLEDLAEQIKSKIEKRSYLGEQILDLYNKRLYKKGQFQKIIAGPSEERVKISRMNRYGQLEAVTESGQLVQYTHGTVEWSWD